MLIGIVWRTVVFAFMVSTMDVLFNGGETTRMLVGSWGGFVVIAIIFVFGLSLGEYITQQRKQ